MTKGKILVMDDENQIRIILSTMLNRMDYDVRVAKDGNEAIELFQCAIGINRPFNIVIMDLKVANGMGGDEGIKRLLEIDEGVKIILCSGSINDHMMTNYTEYGISAIIKKPFKMNDLSSTLLEVNSGCN